MELFDRTVGAVCSRCLRAGGAGARNGVGAFLSLRFRALESLTLRRALCAQGVRLPPPSRTNWTRLVPPGRTAALSTRSTTDFLRGRRTSRTPRSSPRRFRPCPRPRGHLSHARVARGTRVAHTCRTHVSASAGTRVAAAGTRGADSLSPPGNALSRPWTTVGGAALPAHAQGQPRAAPDGRQGRRAEPPALGFTLHTSHFTMSTSR